MTKTRTNKTVRHGSKIIDTTSAPGDDEDKSVDRLFNEEAGQYLVENNQETSSSDDDSSSDEEELALDGVLQENDDSSSEEGDLKPPVSKRNKTSNKPSMLKKSKKKKEKEILQVEFLFCDLDRKFFDGIRTLLSFEPAYSSQSTQLADLLVDDVSVGTVLSTEDNDVFAIASVINCDTPEPCIQELKKVCLQKCPPQHKKELDFAFTDSKNAAGFLVHFRVINVPLTIVEALHQQLVLDMDYAIKHVKDEEERKSLDFKKYIIFAPCDGESSAPMYKYFEDEIFASHAEFVFTFDVPKREKRKLCSVMLLTKAAHRVSMNEISNLVSS